MLKTLCNKIVSCISSLFKSEKDEYREKLIPLQQMIEQQSRIKGSQVKHYPKATPLKLMKDQYQQKQPSKSGIQTHHHPSQHNQQSKISPIKPKALNLESLKTKSKPVSPKFTHPTQPPSSLVKSVSLIKKIDPINTISPDRQRVSNNSEDSFHTLQSGSSSLHSIARRSFKSIKSLRSSKNQEIKSAGEGKNYRKPKVYKKSFDSRDFKSMNNQSFGNDGRMIELQSSNYKDFGVKKISELLIEWNSREYMKMKNFSTPYKRSFSSLRVQQSRFMSQIFYEKIASNSHIDELINRLQDYYTFNFQEKEFGQFQIHELNPTPSCYPTFLYHQSNEQNGPSLIIPEIRSPTRQTRHIQKSLVQKYQQNFGFYFNESVGLKCSYSFSKNQQNNHHMKSIQFYCDTSSPLRILKWYNCCETRSKLFDFHKMYLLQNGIYPVLQVQQYNELYEKKNIYRIVRQIQIGMFENENTNFPESTKDFISRPKIEETKQNEYILQIQMTIEGDMGKKQSEKYSDDKAWKSLLRFEIAERGLVQIYQESCEDINKEKIGIYNKKRWSKFEQKIVRDKIIKYGYKNGIVHD